MQSKIRTHQMCTNCIMDTTDPEITFDDQGVCNHCNFFNSHILPTWQPNERGEKLLFKIVEEIKECKKGQPYNCIMGLSGGVDSSYLAYISVRKLNLKPLVVHVDGGWNSEISVRNIENIVKKLDLDLFTYVVDWEEMRDLQVAFFRAGTPNQDIPQDHVFFAKLYEYAVKNKIRYVLTGSNYAGESILPSSWGYNAMDSKFIKAIHRRYGTRKLKSFPLMSFNKYYFYYPYINRLKIIYPLNYIHYNPREALKILKRELDFRYYGKKHHESRFTKFFQAHYLPTRFGYDKRKAHLSSLIVAGLISRDQALKEMDEPIYSNGELEEDQEFIIKKLGITQEEYDSILAAPLKSFRDYPNHYILFQLKGRLRSMISNLIKFQ